MVSVSSPVVSVVSPVVLSVVVVPCVVSGPSVVDVVGVSVVVGTVVGVPLVEAWVVSSPVESPVVVVAGGSPQAPSQRAQPVRPRSQGRGARRMRADLSQRRGAAGHGIRSGHVASA